jgi:CRP-like cAMP-binding protein
MYSNSLDQRRSRLTRADRRALLDQLRSYPVFAHCAARDLAALIKVSQLCTLPADCVMVAEGAPADFCYVILQGSAAVYRSGVRIAVLGRGVLVGEMATARGKSRSATVTTVTQVSALAIDNAILQLIMRKRPGLDRAVHTQVLERSGVTVHRFEPRIARRQPLTI